VLVLFTPGGFQQFFEELSSLIKALPTPDLVRVEQLMNKYGVEVLRPAAVVNNLSRRPAEDMERARSQLARLGRHTIPSWSREGEVMLRTRLCELLEIEMPVIGAPMGPEIAGLDLAAAVSNAGGLGMISFGGYPPPALRERIRELRTMTSKPFGVNVLLEGPHLPLPESAFVDACIAERVPVLSFFWGDPTPYVEKAHNAGVKVCDQVGSVRAAKRAAAAGVDFIIAQGVEAGGHIAGTVSTMVLTPRVVETVAPIPVVTAGGVADGSGLAAALALGAEGVVLGTRLIASTESNAHQVYKE